METALQGVSLPHSKPFKNIPRHLEEESSHYPLSAALDRHIYPLWQHSLALGTALSSLSRRYSASDMQRNQGENTKVKKKIIIIISKQVMERAFSIPTAPQ